MRSFCIVGLHVDVNNAFMVILCCQQQQNILTSTCKVPDMFVKFYPNLCFVNRFWQKSPISNFMNIHPMGAELIQTDKRTDTTNLIGTFCNYAKAPKTFQLIQLPNLNTRWCKRERDNKYFNHSEITVLYRIHTLPFNSNFLTTVCTNFIKQMHYGEILSVYLNVSFLKLLDRCKIQSYRSRVDKCSSLEYVAWTPQAAGT